MDIASGVWGSSWAPKCVRVTAAALLAGLMLTACAVADRTAGVPAEDAEELVQAAILRIAVCGTSDARWPAEWHVDRSGSRGELVTVHVSKVQLPDGDTVEFVCPDDPQALFADLVWKLGKWADESCGDDNVAGESVKYAESGLIESVSFTCGRKGRV